MRFGRCEWILKKKGDLTRSVIENVFIKIGFSPNNPHLNCVHFFDGMGEENTCGESEFYLTVRTYKAINITLWKGYESIEICFDVTDENYDIFELNINLMDEEECSKLITDITDLVLNNDFDLKGIIFDKCGVLREISRNSSDEQFIDFAFNEKNDIRQKLSEDHKHSAHAIEKFSFPSLTRDNIGNILIFNFLCDGIDVIRFSPT